MSSKKSMSARYKDTEGSFGSWRKSSLKSEQKVGVDTRPLAVALHYDATDMNAPEVAFTGEGEMVREIMKISRNYNVPVKKSDSLARKLSTVAPETPIPEVLYDDVAEIFLSLSKK